MNVLLVTSRVTYVMNNYDLLFKELLRECPEHVSGLVLLENLDSSVLKSTFGLFAIGAWRTATSLILNILDSFFDRRERRFKKMGIPVLRHKSMNNKKIVNWVRENEIDLIINLRTRCIYKKEILDAPKLGCINIHHGILPTYRGTMCDLYALSEERGAGFSIHRMNEKIDDGEIYLAKEVSHGEKNYASHIVRSSVVEGRELSVLIRTIAETGAFFEGTPNRTEKIVFTKNPKPKKIRDLIKLGMKL
ncbi:MAG: hypothetical protein KAG61_11875 [Bacteriovoracaceae bacterium]|nr:hypothetical protein [Bacteriovoracaceae bacterium]